MSIGEKIKKIRKERGYTQQELAIKAGISIMSIQRYERNYREANIEALNKIAKALFIPITELIIGYENIEPIIKVGEIPRDITVFTTDELLNEIKRRIENGEKND